MRKAQREVKDRETIEDILQHAQVMHLGLQDTDGDGTPYIVPLSYGFERGCGDGSYIFYFHCAKEGKKMDLYEAGCRKVFVEMDILNGYKSTGHSVTADYESFMGTGWLSRVTDKDEIIHGLKCILDHCGVTGYDPVACEAAGRVCVMKVCVGPFDYTAKKRFI